MTSFFVGNPSRRPASVSRHLGALLRGRKSAPERLGGLVEEEVETLRADLEAARTELARRDSYLNALLETVDVGIISCGPDGSDWARNRAGREILGLNSPTGRGLDPTEVAPQVDIRDADGHRVAVDDYPLLRALRGEEVGAVELLIGPAGGPHREVITSNSQILDATGTVLGAVSALTDVSAERAALRSAAAQSRMLVEAQRIGQLGSFEHDLVTGEWSFSEQLHALWGPASPGATETTGPLSLARIHPEDRDAARAAWTQLCTEGGKLTSEHRIVRFNGEERRLRSVIEAEVGPDGVPTRIRGTNLDITELSAAQTAAREASEFIHAVLTASPDYTFVTDLATGAVVYGSRGKDILGLSSEDISALGPDLIAKLVHPDDIGRLRALNVQAAGLEDGAVLRVRYRGRHVDGSWRWLSRRVTPFTRDASGAAVQVIGVMRDITDTVLAEERLQHTATHDGLTGLPNRTLLMQRLQDALDRSAVHGGEVTVLFCDLDGFKLVNDSSGHAAGDAVLQVTGRRIREIIRADDTVARVGGDEFVVVLEPRSRTSLAHAAPDQDSRDRERAVAHQIATRITAAVRRSIRYDGAILGVTASVGMTFASLPTGDGDERVTAESVLRRADDLMYRAKAHGKDRVEILAVS